MAKRLDPYRPVGKLAPTYGRDGFRIRADGVLCLPTKDGKPGAPLAQVMRDMNAPLLCDTFTGAGVAPRREEFESAGVATLRHLSELERLGVDLSDDPGVAQVLSLRMDVFSEVHLRSLPYRSEPDVLRGDVRWTRARDGYKELIAFTLAPELAVEPPGYVTAYVTGGEAR